MSFTLPDFDDEPFDIMDIRNTCCVNTNMIQENEGVYICKICSKLNPDYSLEHGIHEDNAFNTIAITGKDAFKYRKIVHSNTDYSTIRDKNTNRQFDKMDNDNKIPKAVMRQAKELYIKIQSAGIVLRANKRKGTMAQCFYYAFNMEKTIKEISEIIKVPEKSMRIGDEILIELFNKKIIDIKIQDNTVNYCLEQLKVSPDYHDFINAVVNTNFNMEVVTKTIKCIGVIYYMNFAFGSFKHKNLLKPLFTDGLNREFKTFCQIVKMLYDVNKPVYNKVFQVLIDQRPLIKEFCITYKVPYPVKRKGKRFEDFYLIRAN